MKKYIVRDGDTLLSISQVTGVRLSLLQSANPQIQNPHVLQPGQVISIPELDKGSPAGEPAMRPVRAEDEPKPSASEKTQKSAEKAEELTQRMPGYFGLVWPHVVQEGETWASIADAYQIPLVNLQNMNASRSVQSLQAGDILYVPNVVTPMPVSATAPTTVPPMAGAYPVSPYREGPHYGAPLPSPYFPSYDPSRSYVAGWPNLGAWQPMGDAHPSVYPPGPYAMFAGEQRQRDPRAADALWRRAYGEASHDMQDFDESSSFDSGITDDGWGGQDPHAKR